MDETVSPEHEAYDAASAVDVDADDEMLVEEISIDGMCGVY